MTSDERIIAAAVGVGKSMLVAGDPAARLWRRIGTGGRSGGGGRRPGEDRMVLDLTGNPAVLGATT